MPLNGKALAAMGIGSLFVWSGIKGWSVLGTVGDLVTGKPPTQPVTNPLTASQTGTESIGTVPGGSSAIASTAVQYQGHAYKFGGAPGRDGTRPWDCSSAVNFVVGIRLGMAIPGYGPGKYDGSVHGPPTGGWAAWSGLAHVKRSEVQAGDIIVWLAHMGIALGPNQMISALNPAQGTKITPIDGYGNGPLITCGRFK